MRLFHYTGQFHLATIMSAGFLKVTESNVGSGSPLMPPMGVRVGPDVVWLTTSVTGDGCGLESFGVGSAKREVRFTVDVDDAVRWIDWPPAQLMHPRWRAGLTRNANADSWYVVERPIPMAEWVAVEGAPVQAGRNELCPCGSGAKFKRCHLDEGGARPVIWTSGTVAA